MKNIFIRRIKKNIKDRKCFYQTAAITFLAFCPKKKSKIWEVPYSDFQNGVILLSWVTSEEQQKVIVTPII